MDPKDLSRSAGARYSTGKRGAGSSAHPPAGGSEPLLDASAKVRTPLKRKPSNPHHKNIKTLNNRRRRRPRRQAGGRSFADLCYRYCYYVGIQLMRMGKRYRHRLRGLLAGLKAHRTVRSTHLTYARQRRKDRFLRSFTLPFREMSVLYRNKTERYRQHHGGHSPGALATALNLLTSCRPVLAMLANHLLPVMALMLLLSTIYHYNTMTLALSVSYEGHELGYISDEAVFNEAQTAVKQRIVSEEDAANQKIIPTYALVVADPDQLTSVDTLTDRLISASGSALEEASGLYISDKFLGAVEDGDKLLDYLNSVLEKSRTGAEDETVSFIKKIALKKGLYPVSSVVPLQDLVDTISKDEQVEQVYIIRTGDTPTGVASKNNMPYSTLKALNPDIEKTSFFHAGSKVLISKAVAFLSTKISRTEVYEEDIPYGSDSTSDNRYPVGYKVVTRAGVAGKQQVTANVTYVDGVEESRTVLKTVVLSEPVNEKVLVGTQRPVTYIQGSSASSAGFMWPVDWGYFNGSINSYWGHTGMDIAGNYLAPVRAAKAGTVVYSAWYGPYGNHVIIDHGNGVQTLYAHMNDRYVVVGQKVSQGELIGRVGRTGNVTGAHLHFEVRVNGRIMDPVKYVGTYKH